ncbi:MAG: YajQ family cyclic di-GMP-binding protein [Armatimonas sp.]
MADFSFDVVSKADMQEVKNAVDQAQREIDTRFDFKGSESTIELDEKANKLELGSDSEARLTALVDVLETKLHRRGIDIRQLELGKVVEGSKGTVRQDATIKQGLDSDTAKKIVKAIKDAGIKAQAAIQGDQVRVSSKSKDDLQKVQALVRDGDWGIPVKFDNYR